MTREGIPTEVHVYPGAFHAFQVMRGTRVAQAAERDSRAALSRFLNG
ncbi:dienelactone hydrolase family protein [Phenylobacterium sp.]